MSVKLSNNTDIGLIRRILHNMDHEPPEKIVVTLSIPLKNEDNDWYCKFKIKGNKQKSGTIYGIDPFQALLIVLDVIRKYLAENYKTLQWEGGEVGDHGFSLIVPSFLNKAIVGKLEKIINTELEKSESYQCEKGVKS